ASGSLLNGIRDVAVNPLTGAVWAVVANGLVQLNPTTGAQVGTTAGTTTTYNQFNGLGFSADGMLYVAAVQNTPLVGAVLRYDPATNAANAVIVAGGVMTSAQRLAVQPS